MTLTNLEASYILLKEVGFESVLNDALKMGASALRELQTIKDINEKLWNSVHDFEVETKEKDGEISELRKDVANLETHVNELNRKLRKL